MPVRKQRWDGDGEESEEVGIGPRGWSQACRRLSTPGSNANNRCRCALDGLDATGGADADIKRVRICRGRWWSVDRGFILGRVWFGVVEGDVGGGESSVSFVRNCDLERANLESGNGRALL